MIAAAGCDSVGTDVRPLDDVLVVSVVADDPMAQPVLAFVTEGVPGCATPIAHRTRVGSDRLTVEVEGLEVSTGPECLALIPSWFSVTIPRWAAEGVDVEVHHRGETDRYRILYGDEGPALAAVRTSVTRPGPR